MSGWAAILGAARCANARASIVPAPAPRAAQIALLRSILADNAGSEFGRAHGFADI